MKKRKIKGYKKGNMRFKQGITIIFDDSEILK